MIECSLRWSPRLAVQSGVLPFPKELANAVGRFPLGDSAVLVEVQTGVLPIGGAGIEKDVGVRFANGLRPQDAHVDVLERTQKAVCPDPAGQISFHVVELRNRR